MRGENRTALVILNASSGWADKSDVADRISSIFQQQGWECTVSLVEAGTDIEAIAREAVLKNTGRVVAGGGDGTLRAVASALTGTGVPMGVLPAGTLNHFARDLEIPLDLGSAAEIAAGGTEVCVDVAEVNGSIFLNNSVLGLYPFFRIHRDAHQAAGSSKIRAIGSALFRLLRIYPYLSVRVKVNGSLCVRRTPYLMIANNQHAMEGFKPWQRDSITAGHLWIYILRSRSRIALLRALAKIVVGGRLAEDEFEVLRAEEVTIETPRRQLKVSLDGELVSVSSPLHYRSCHGQLHVLVSPGSKRVSESVCPAEQVQ